MKRGKPRFFYFRSVLYFELCYNDNVKMINEWRCVKMVNKNAITKRRGLQLRRDIMVCDEKNEREYINGVRFNNSKHVQAVFDILKYWDFQSKLHGDDSVLYDLIRDSELTYHLKQILHYYTYSDNASTATAKLTELLKSLGNIDNYDDDAHIIDTMIYKLDLDRTGWALNGLSGYWWDDVENRLTAMYLYLRKLQNEMAIDEGNVGMLDIYNNIKIKNKELK